MATWQRSWRNLFYSFVLLHCVCHSVEGTEKEESHAECKPEHVHLSYGSVTSEMVVMWETRRSCPSAEVQYGIGSPFNLDLVATGKTHDLSGCGGVNCSLNFIHTVPLKDLSPSSTVYYLPVTGGVRAGPFYFHVPGQDETKPLQFIVSSITPEGGQTDMLKSLEKVIYQHPYSGIFLMNKPEQLICQSGEHVLTQMEQLATDLPLMIGADAEPGDEVCAQNVFSMPGHSQTKTSSRKRWYSLDVGMVHFIVYSSKVFLEKDPKQGKAMQTWMIDDLTKANKKRSQSPWIVAIGSDPMYCQAEGGAPSPPPEGTRDCMRNDSRIRHGLEDLFYHFAVDLVLELQHGVYERTWPHYKGVRTSKSYEHPASPVEVILAHGVLSEDSPPEDVGNETTKVVKADWTAQRFQAVSNSYGHLSVANASHLHFEWRQSTNGKGEVVLDDFWLVQERHGNFSLSTLPHNVSHKINQSIIAMGGKPGTYDFISTLTPDPSKVGEGWSKYSLWFGLGLVGVAIFVGLGVATIRSYVRRRRSNAGRRWREVDRQGGDGSGHFYSMASDSDSEENDHDFEIDMFERTAKSESKLLTSY